MGKSLVVIIFLLALFSTFFIEDNGLFSGNVLVNFWINAVQIVSPLVLKIETIYVPILAVQYRQKYLQKQTCQVLYTGLSFFIKFTILILEKVLAAFLSSFANIAMSSLLKVICKTTQRKTKGGKLFSHIRDSCVNFQFRDKDVL
jgi:hypothetical protein